MLEFIRGWVIQIAGIIIFSSVCEAIVPNGGLKKYINTVLGIILVLAVVTPFTTEKFGNLSYKIKNFEQYDAYVSQLNTDEIQKEQIVQVYNKKLATKIQENIKSALGIENAEVILETETENAEHFGEIKHIVITVDCLSENEKNKIIQIIQNIYGVYKDNIELRG